MTTEPSTGSGGLSIGQLVASIKDDITKIVRGEIDLAKAELRDEAKSASAGGALGVVAALLVLIALVLLSITLVIVVNNTGITRGWAFAIVGGGYIVLAAVLGLIAKYLFGRVTGPERTRASAQRAAEALRPSNRS